MTPEVWLYFGTVILERGLPAAMNIYERFKKADPTLSDLEALKKLAVDPDKEENEPENQAWVKGQVAITAVHDLLQLLEPDEVAPGP